MNYHFIFKFIIIGDSGVGKSCIVQRFLENKFSDDQENTIGVEFGTKVIGVQDKHIKLQIWDTAGQEAFQSITRSYYRSSAGALVVFDITCMTSFQNCVTWFNEVREHGNQEMVVYLIGNKCDLESQYLLIFITFKTPSIKSKSRGVC